MSTVRQAEKTQGSVRSRQSPKRPRTRENGAYRSSSLVLPTSVLPFAMPSAYTSSLSSSSPIITDHSHRQLTTGRRTCPQTCSGKPSAPCSCSGRGRGRWGGSSCPERSTVRAHRGRFPRLWRCSGWWRDWRDAPAEEGRSCKKLIMTAAVFSPES